MRRKPDQRDGVDTHTREEPAVSRPGEASGPNMTYDGAGVRASIEADRARLFASYAEGRPPGWTVDQWTKDFVCLSIWLREELTRALGPDDVAGRKAEENEFYRRSRGSYDPDLFELAASIMNDAVAGNIDRERLPHRRWG